ncbi:MAG: hypothetical protein HUU54_01845 [Ignavibacteriaceae bacterium]|nr:hypothetical protein [Ignavibacteriaceae bacterium]
MFGTRMGTFILFLVLTVFTQMHLAQERTLSISAAADSLQELLSYDNQRPDTKRFLIEEYIRNSEIEMALLELLDFSEEKGYNDDVHRYRGEILLGVGNFKGALKEIKMSYLMKPDNSKLMNLAFSYFGLGNEELAKKIYDQLLNLYPGTDSDALVLHSQLYKGGRATVTNLIPSFYKSFYPDKYIKYFPSPQMTVLSPENNSSVFGETSVLFSVNHSRPVILVEVNDEILFSSSGEENESEAFSREFNHKLNIPAGPVKITIKATDLYGFTARTDLYLLGLNFNRDASWRSSYSDSLYAGISFLNSFIPRDFTKSVKYGNTNIIVFSPAVKDYTDFQKAVFWYDLLSSEQIGVTDKKNIKPILLEDAGSENFRRVYDDWLLKSTNFQSRTLVYLSSPISVTDNSVSIRSADGNMFDILQNISSSFRIMSDGLLIIFEGETDHPEKAEVIFSKLLAETPFPAAIILGNRADLTQSVINSLLKPEAAGFSEPGPAIFDFASLSTSDPSIRIFTSPKGMPAIIENPSGKALRVHRDMLILLESKLKNDKVLAPQADKIRTYCSDWKMYNDISRFVRNDLSLADLLIKIDEYNLRTGGN